VSGVAGLLATESRRVSVGYGAALISALGYGAGAIVARHIVVDYASPMTTTAFSLLFGTLLVGLPSLGHVRQDVSRAPSRAWLFVGMAGITSAVGVSFFILAIDAAPVVVAAPVTGAYPLVSIVLSFFFINRMERITWRTVLGGLLVVGGVTLVAFG
jgi:drug/metabolite transporter, DME family